MTVTVTRHGVVVGHVLLGWQWSLVPKLVNLYSRLNYVVTTSGILYGWSFCVPGRGNESSGYIYPTEQGAWDACEKAMKDYDWPAGQPDTGGAKWWPGMLPPPLWTLVRQDLAHDPREVERGPRYKEPDNRKLWFHCTPARCLESIMTHGLECRALEDVAGSGVAHSKLPEAVWGARTIDQCRRHMMSKDTINRHVSNNLTTYATWNKVALIAIRLEGSGWNRIHTPDYPQSGCTYQSVVAFAGRAFDLAEDGNLAAMRAWAASL